jgi:serine/threonine-protein kinase
MGEVHRARDVRLGREVALKLLPPRYTQNEERLRRFEHEARTTSALNHPNIVTIYDIGQVEDLHYIAMEYVVGRTLRQHIERAAMPLQQGLEICCQVAGALAVAHAAGIVHRDIKPENIIFRPDGYVKVLDFGLAKLMEPIEPQTDSIAPTRVSAQTAPGTVMGTVSYMSPEQARGLDLDGRTDLWSLGVVLYELITGRPPFTGATGTDIVVAIIERDPVPLSDAFANAPAELERIMMKALAKDRDERYQTAADMAADLRRLKHELDLRAGREGTESEQLVLKAASGGVLQPRPLRPTASSSVAPASAAVDASTSQSIIAFVTRHPRTLPALTIAAVILIGLVIYLSGGKSRSIDSIAIMPLANQSGDPNMDYLSDGITESLINNLSQLPDLKVMSRASVFRYKGQDVDPEEVGRKLKVQALLTGRVGRQGDTIAISLDLVDARDDRQLWGAQYTHNMSDLVTAQAEISRKVLEQLRVKLTGEEERRVTKLYTDNAEAYQLYLKGRFQWNKLNEEGLNKAIDYFTQAIGKDSTYALGYAGLADSYSILAANFVPPKDAIPKAKSYAKRALDLDPQLAEAHYAQGSVHFLFDWDLSAAEKEARRALALNPNYTNAHILDSYVLQAMGRFDEAIAQGKLALELDPLSLIANACLGLAYYYAGQYDQTIEQNHNLLEIEPKFFLIYVDLARAYEQKGMYDQALNELSRARELVGDEPTVLAEIGYAYARSGKTGEARKILDKLNELAGQKYVQEYEIAAVYVALGEKDQAFALLDKAYAQPSAWLIMLRVEPKFAVLRQDERFQAFLRKIGPQPATESSLRKDQ